MGLIARMSDAAKELAAEYARWSKNSTPERTAAVVVAREKQAVDGWGSDSQWVAPATEKGTAPKT